MLHLGLAFLAKLTAAESAHYDAVIYGGASSGVAAAVQVARMGKSVVIVEPGWHLDGTVTSQAIQSPSIEGTCLPNRFSA